MQKNRLILALDKNSLAETKDLCIELAGDVCFFKLGMEFFYAFGKDGLKEIAKIGVPIFLDLKLHDIPNTVLKACLSLLSDIRGVEILTLHASGGEKMLHDANISLINALPKKLMIFGVTVLTSSGEADTWNGSRIVFPFAMGILRAVAKLEKLSHDKKVQDFIKTRIKNMVETANNTLMYWACLYPQEEERIEKVNTLLSKNVDLKNLNLRLKCNVNDPAFYKKNALSGGILNEVLRLSQISFESGIDGVVCSGIEAPFVKKFFPSLKIITPGIRPKWYNEKDDQTRVLTPREAILNGADYIVIGRPITKSSNPKEAIRKTIEEISDL